jgi:hypothetical protein
VEPDTRDGVTVQDTTQKNARTRLSPSTRLRRIQQLDHDDVIV